MMQDSAKKISIMSTGIPAPHSRSVIPFGTVLSCLLLFFVLIVPGCTKEHRVSFQGYVEGEYLRVSSPFAGQLVSLAV
ncbi:MAG TPA: hypothetical protein ENH16_02215, partial [Desulfobacteraceae bacterium]|nr:hypothetical protein [Desulfobacteraceae bacterium]